MHMTERIYVTQDNKARFVCPECKKEWVKDVSAFVAIENAKRIKAKCTCGNSWSCIFEKRRFFRKEVSLHGLYIYKPPGRPQYKGDMEVLNLSLKGLRIKLDVDWEFKIGEWLEVRFQLDNKARTTIRRKVQIKNISGRSVGCSFRETESEDPDIGFYLLK